MNIHTLIVCLAGPLAVALANGCTTAQCKKSSTDHSVGTSQLDGTEGSSASTQPPEDDMPDKPFMFNEAPLPEGFPPVGPVGQVIVKKYPAYRAAVADAEALRSADQGTMFNALFKHIKREKIAMTAPVEMLFPLDDVNQTEGNPKKPNAMAFMYRSTAQGQTGEDERSNGAVVVKDFPAQTVLSVAIRGGYGRSPYLKASEQLRAYFEAHPDQFKVVGPPRVLGYNSPFVPSFLRVSEVQWPVEQTIDD